MICSTWHTVTGPCTSTFRRPCLRRAKAGAASWNGGVPERVPPPARSRGQQLGGCGKGRIGAMVVTERLTRAWRARSSSPQRWRRSRGLPGRHFARHGRPTPGLASQPSLLLRPCLRTARAHCSRQGRRARPLLNCGSVDRLCYRVPRIQRSAQQGLRNTAAAPHVCTCGVHATTATLHLGSFVLC